jgi:hypothetical protein
MHHGEPLREGYVEAFGVDSQLRRRGIGTALQQHAARQCQIAGRYQMRSRSPVTSTENYALKIAAGYVLHPATKMTPITSSCACNQSGKVYVQPGIGIPTPPENALICRGNVGVRVQGLGAGLWRRRP